MTCRWRGLCWMEMVNRMSVKEGCDMWRIQRKPLHILIASKFRVRFRLMTTCINIGTVVGPVSEGTHNPIH
jgi:hypothetical protein